MQKPVRYLSLDAMRGWTVAAMLLVNNAGDWNHVLPWLEHAEWSGCSPADLIFPLFLFIAGLSLECSFAPALEQAISPDVLRKQAIWRGVRLFALGVFLHGLASLTIDGRAFRLMGVLQRIGIVFAVAACLMLHWRSERSRWAVLATLLTLHSTLLLAGGTLLPHQNLSDRIDTALLGTLAYQFDPATGWAQDPEGLLSTLGAVCSTLAGIQAATLLRTGRLRQLFWLATGSLLAGILLAMILPWNKQLWTASFVCWSSGWAMLFLLASHWLLDIRGFPAIGRSFGRNAIAAYAGSWIMACLLALTGWGAQLYRLVFIPYLVPLLGEAWSSAAFATSLTAVFGVLTWWMARKNWRIVI